MTMMEQYQLSSLSGAGKEKALKSLEILKYGLKFIFFFRNILLSALTELLSIMRDLSCLGIKQKRDRNGGSLVAQSSI